MTQESFLGQGDKIPWDPESVEEIVMDFVGELLAIDRCLKSPAFRPGDVTQAANGRAGTVASFRLLITAEGFGNEYEVRWEDGQTDWVDGRNLTLSPRNGGKVPCASATSFSTT
jgi:hypothetical protein